MSRFNNLFPPKRKQFNTYINTAHVDKCFSYCYSWVWDESGTRTKRRTSLVWHEHSKWWLTPLYTGVQKFWGNHIQLVYIFILLRIQDCLQVCFYSCDYGPRRFENKFLYVSCKSINQFEAENHYANPLGKWRIRDDSI